MDNSKKPKESVMDMAVAVLDGNPHPLDMEMEGIDPSPTSLDMPEEKYQEMCSRCSRPAVDACAACGSPLCAYHGLTGTKTGESGEGDAGVAKDHAEGVA